jgi:hypothetical protein
LSIIQGAFSVTPCQTLVSRFATFSSPYGVRVSEARVETPRLVCRGYERNCNSLTACTNVLRVQNNPVPPPSTLTLTLTLAVGHRRWAGSWGGLRTPRVFSSASSTRPRAQPCVDRARRWTARATSTPCSSCCSPPPTCRCLGRTNPLQDKQGVGSALQVHRG